LAANIPTDAGGKAAGVRRESITLAGAIAMPTRDNNPASLHCPSAQTTNPDAVVFGLVTGPPEALRIGYLTEVQPVTESLIALAGSAKPGQVFRSAAPCIGHACKHYDGADCALAKRVTSFLEPVVNALPACQIRPTCRWFRQEGKAACVRCPQVITDKHQSVEEYRLVGDPEFVEPVEAAPG